MKTNNISFKYNNRLVPCTIRVYYIKLELLNTNLLCCTFVRRKVFTGVMSS